MDENPTYFVNPEWVPVFDGDAVCKDDEPSQEVLRKWRNYLTLLCNLHMAEGMSQLRYHLWFGDKYDMAAKMKPQSADLRLARKYLYRIADDHTANRDYDWSLAASFYISLWGDADKSSLNKLVFKPALCPIPARVAYFRNFPHAKYVLHDVELKRI